MGYRPARRMSLPFAPRHLVVAVAIAVVASALTPIKALAAPARFTPLTAQSEHVVAGRSGTPLPFAPDPAAAHALTGTPSAVGWPAAGTATVDLPATRSASQASVAPGSLIQAGTLPVRIGPVGGSTGMAASANGSAVPDAPGRVTVSVLAHASQPAGRADAVELRLTRADGVAGAGPVMVAVDDATFRQAYGGDWEQRLHLETLPDCALTTPMAAGCRGTALPTTRHGTTLAAQVAIVGGAGTVVALTAGASGASGSYGATTLSASGSW